MFSYWERERERDREREREREVTKLSTDAINIDHNLLNVILKNTSANFYLKRWMSPDLMDNYESPLNLFL